MSVPARPPLVAALVALLVTTLALPVAAAPLPPAPASAASSPASGPAPELSGPEAYDLERSLATAREHHPALRRAAALRRASDAAAGAAARRYLPRLEAYGTVERVFAGDKQVVVDELLLVRTLPVDSFYTALLRLRVPLLEEGRLAVAGFPSKGAAAAYADSLARDEEEVQAEVLAAVRLAFFRALAAQEGMAASARLVELRMRLRDDAGDRLAQELAARVDLLAAEADLAAAEAERLVARAEQQRSLASFVASLGLEPEPGRVAAIRLVDAGDEPPPELTAAPSPARSPGPAEEEERDKLVPSLDDVLGWSLARHPRILGQQARIRRQQHAYRRERSERWPRLEADASVGGIRDVDGPTDAWSGRVYLRLSWPLFDFARGRERREQAELLQAEREALGDTTRVVRQTLLDAWNDLQASRARRDAAAKAVELYEERARNAGQRLEQELVPPSEVLRAEADLEIARKTLAQARYEARSREALLRLAAALD